jgi:hypothetical protein
VPGQSLTLNVSRTCSGDEPRGSANVVAIHPIQILPLSAPLIEAYDALRQVTANGAGSGPRPARRNSAMGADDDWDTIDQAAVINWPLYSCTSLFDSSDHGRLDPSRCSPLAADRPRHPGPTVAVC